jgi:putative FmdB family regulatory protein
MPTYEYVCRACGHEFEEFQSIKADPIAVCPKCRKKKVERKIGLGGAVIFKGGGFYETDYRSESYKSGEDAEKKANNPAPAASDAANSSKNSTGAALKSDSKRAGAAEPMPSAQDAARGDTRGNTRGDTRGDTKAKQAPDANAAASGDTSAAAAEKKRIEDRATHPSRIGRGIGNVVKKSSDAARVAKSANSSAKSAAKGSSKITKKSSRK